MALQMRESHVSIELDDSVDDSRGYRIGDSERYEPFTDDRGRLFRSLQSEYGRCTGKVYAEYQVFDGQPGELQAWPVGWCFRKTRPYDDDAHKSYVHEVWVEVRDVPEREA